MINLEVFAETIGQRIILTRYPAQNGRWCCHIDRAEVVDDGFLIGAHGNGPTPGEAMADYAAQIAGKRIAISAGDASRHYHNVPADLGSVTPPPNTVRVRVAVSVDEEGAWAAAGGSSPDYDPMDDVEHDADRRLSWITADVPKPEPAAEIVARVEVGE